MGKKRNKKKKNKFNKARIFQATQNLGQESSSLATAVTANGQTTGTSNANPLFQNKDRDQHEDQFAHVMPDLKFFSFVAVLMLVILVVIYFYDASSGIILTAGQKIYDILHLN